MINQINPTLNIITAKKWTVKNCGKKKKVKEVTEPLGTAMLRTILVVQLRSSDCERFSHFSSFDFDRIWSAKTPSGHKRLRKQKKTHEIWINLGISMWSLIVGDWLCCAVETKVNEKGKHLAGVEAV